MDWLTFIANVLKAVAWPIAAIVIVAVFRKQISDLIRRIKKGKVGSTEFEFESILRDLSAGTEITDRNDKQFLLMRNVEISPNEARRTVFESWLEVESAARRLAAKLSKDHERTFRIPYAAIREISKAEVLDEYYLSLLNELRYLRNKAAHEADFSPSIDSVIRYMELSEKLKHVLEDAERKLKRST